MSSPVQSLVAEVTEPSAKYLKYLSNTEEDGDDGEGVHGAEEDGLLEVFGHHALRHIKGLFQSTGITHVERVDLEEEDRHQMVNSSETQRWCNLSFQANLLRMVPDPPRPAQDQQLRVALDRGLRGSI